MCHRSVSLFLALSFLQGGKKKKDGVLGRIDMKTFSFLGLKSRGGKEIKAAGKNKRICDCVCACACFGVRPAGRQFCDSSRTPGVSLAL